MVIKSKDNKQITLLLYSTHKVATAFGIMFIINSENESLTDRTSPSIISLPQIKQNTTSKMIENKVMVVKQERIFTNVDVDEGVVF